MVTLAEYEQRFIAHGWTDVAYLRRHFERYRRTKARAHANGCTLRRGKRLLDVGAHWLHQALMYAMDGFEVTALDLPVTFEIESVRNLAKAHNITLLSNENLEQPAALAQVADNSFDLVLFTEIIEHIAFNPISLWREIYRVMREGARIVVTTPNYYALRGRTWDWARFLKGFGGGLDTLDMLNHHTHAVHWKEYSLRELIRYFSVLSPDFSCVNSAHVGRYSSDYPRRLIGSIARLLERTVPVLRPDIYAEIELMRKDKGIVIEPRW
jgi:2-polyprenyl-3-methyl-5-hydroxy-6-metoxy-1,4-benzoquinol methylase